MFGGGARTRRVRSRSTRSPPRGVVTRFPSEPGGMGSRPGTRATVRFRILDKTFGGDEEAPPLRGRGRNAWVVRRIRSRSRGRLRRIVFGLARYFRLIQVAAICSTTTFSLWLFRQAWTSVYSPLRISGPMSGPDGIYPTIIVERARPLSGGSYGDRHEGSAQICRNTQQGKTLLTDSEGRVCPRTRLDPFRLGCCELRPLAEEMPSHGRALFARGSEADHGIESPDHPAMVVKHDEGADAPARGAYDGYTAEDALVAGAIAPPSEAIFTPFSCWSCQPESSCCLVFEFCVSCCLDPQRAQEREDIDSAAARNGHPVYALKQAESGGRDRNLGRSAETDPRSDQTFEHCVFRCRTYSGSVAHENSYRGPLKHCFGWYRPPTALGMSPNSDGTRRGELPAPRGSGGTEARPVLHLDPYLAGIRHV